MIVINTNIVALGEKIQRLRDLKVQCEGLDVRTVPSEGSGWTNAQLWELDNQYTVLRDAMTGLLDNSIQFFENVRQSMVEADEASAAGIVGGGGFR